KWLPGRKESTGWKESPLKQTDRHHKSPGGDLCIRDSSDTGKVQNGNHDVWRLILIMPVSHPTGKPGVFPIYWPEHFLRIIVSASQPHQIQASQTAPGAGQPHPAQKPSCRLPLN
ncbi:hypothetical protein C2D16_24570, partial [Escherichia coli]|nr:hypothetical protein [Escherichia coli]